MTNFTTESLDRLAQTHGVASIGDLRSCGLTRHQVTSLRRKGHLVPVVRGVYRHRAFPLTEMSRCAAVCAAQPTGIIAGPTAGRIWSFRQLPSDMRIHLIVLPNANPCVLPWVVAHRTLALHDTDRVERDDGIVVLSRLRAAADMARFDIRDSALSSILEQAMHDGGYSPDDLRRVVFDWRAPARRWVDRVLAVLGNRVPGGAAESHDEFLVGDALAAAGVSGLIRQHRLHVPGFGTVRFDLAVPDLRWAIEVDVFPTHREVAGRTSDVVRDAATLRAGWDTSRLGPSDLGVRLPSTVQRLRSEHDRRRAALLRDG